MKYLTKQEIFDFTNGTFVSGKNGSDWGKFQDYSAYQLILRMASDRYYCESISRGETTPDNDTTLKSVIQLASIIGVTVPVIGGALAILSEVFSGLNINTYSEISKSGIASNRLKEWNGRMSQNYGLPINNNLPLTQLITWYISQNNIVAGLIPKCISPTTNCKNEHVAYQIRVSLMREAQESVLKIYRDYITTNKIDMFNNDFANEKNNIETPKNTSSKAGLLGLFLTGLLFSKGIK